ncbi:MAG TPA: DUF599 domain-containing protein [Hyphomicrobium sp.]|nr:DUF599 domain-containing protein [Hyphomicrobium sp.]
MLDIDVPLTDVVAVAVFFACWFGYGPSANILARSRPSLMAAVRIFRHAWIARMCARENHVSDAALLGNLLRGALFFASTTVFILGGLAALLGTATKVAEVTAQLPYATQADARIAEIKVLTLVVLFIYAFFKFTWSAWQYNVLSIMVGAMPDLTADAKIRTKYIDAGAYVASMAGEAYNSGIRAYYFSIPLMAWLIHPLLLLAATIAITIVIYRREFRSQVLKALQSAES